MVLGIDAGTTGVRTFAIDDASSVVRSAYREFPQYFPQPGWVEHDPEEIWSATLETLAEVVRACEDAGDEVAAIGITNQRETTVVWDRATGRPLHRAIVWQDRRTAARCDELRAAGHEPLVRERTGLVLDPYFSATKLAWLLTEGGVARSADLAFGTVDSWILWKLTEGAVHATEPSNASRTLLFDIRTGDWSDELCALFDVPRSALGEVRPTSGRFGTSVAAAAAGLTVPVSGMAGDQQSALFGQACFDPGMAKNTYGTGSFVLVNLGTSAPPPAEGLLTTVAWKLGDVTTYAMEGAIFVTGAAVQWLRDELKIIEQAAEIGPLAASVPDAGGVMFVPAFTGLGSPHWDPYARGTVLGLTRGSGRAQLARGGGRGDGVPDRRRGRRRAHGLRHRARGAPGRRRRERDGRALPVPGRRARRHRPATRGAGDHRARRGLPGRDRRGCVGHAGGGRVGVEGGSQLRTRAGPHARGFAHGHLAPRGRAQPRLGARLDSAALARPGAARGQRPQRPLQLLGQDQP